MGVTDLLDVCAYAAFAYGAFVFGGRGAAAFVAGAALLLLSYAAGAPRPVPVAKIVRRRSERRPPKEIRVPEPVITNADVDAAMRSPGTNTG